MRAAIKMREQFETAQTPGINVVFHVPGRLLAPDWSELRIERFSRKKQLLLVSVPVPQEIIGSDLSLIHRFVVESLRSASNLALEVFHDKGIAFPIADAEKLFAQTRYNRKLWTR